MMKLKEHYIIVSGHTFCTNYHQVSSPPSLVNQTLFRSAGCIDAIHPALRKRMQHIQRRGKGSASRD